MRKNPIGEKKVMTRKLHTAGVEPDTRVYTQLHSAVPQSTRTESRRGSYHHVFVCYCVSKMTLYCHSQLKQALLLPWVVNPRGQESKSGFIPRLRRSPDHTIKNTFTDLSVSTYQTYGLHSSSMAMR